MRALIVHAHPSPESFSAALAREVAAALAGRGYAVDSCDLYAEGFDPVLPLATIRHYLDPTQNRAGVEAHVERLKAADAVTFVFPVWNDGPPAILKGWFDRVLVPGVAVEIVDGIFYPALKNIRQLGTIALYGAERAHARKVGDLPRRFFRHNLGTLVAPDARRTYLAAYDMDHASGDDRAAFVDKVRRVFRKF